MTTSTAGPKPRYRRTTSPAGLSPQADRIVNRIIAVAAGAGMCTSLAVAFVSSAGLLR
ncbi:hypothetical protein [Frondihabitans peucedani]|uniref:Uncharacterized protein n=1 Tax=Frondihabitans peucedani TaxID=598626 RepID=A0ABP8DZP0_9MICO